jgi:hypothetical protein
VNAIPVERRTVLVVYRNQRSASLEYPIVERYIGEYRALLQEDESCRVGLRKTLDIFVDAGWPAAQKLSYKLDEIFR